MKRRKFLTLCLSTPIFLHILPENKYKNDIDIPFETLFIDDDQTQELAMNNIFCDTDKTLFALVLINEKGEIKEDYTEASVVHNYAIVKSSTKDYVYFPMFKLSNNIIQQYKDKMTHLANLKYKKLGEGLILKRNNYTGIAIINCEY